MVLPGLRALRALLGTSNKRRKRKHKTIKGDSSANKGDSDCVISVDCCCEQFRGSVDHHVNERCDGADTRYHSSHSGTDSDNRVSSLSSSSRDSCFSSPCDANGDVDRCALPQLPKHCNREHGDFMLNDNKYDVTGASSCRCCDSPWGTAVRPQNCQCLNSVQEPHRCRRQTDFSVATNEKQRRETVKDKLENRIKELEILLEDERLQKRMLVMRTPILQRLEETRNQHGMVQQNVISAIVERLKCLESENLSLRMENEQQHKQYEKCLDDVANQVVHALLIQKGLQEECAKFKRCIEDLERQNRTLRMIFQQQLQRSCNYEFQFGRCSTLPKTRTSATFQSLHGTEFLVRNGPHRPHSSMSSSSCDRRACHSSSCTSVSSYSSSSHSSPEPINEEHPPLIDGDGLNSSKISTRCDFLCTRRKRFSSVTCDPHKCSLRNNCPRSLTCKGNALRQKKCNNAYGHICGDTRSRPIRLVSSQGKQRLPRGLNKDPSGKSATVPPPIHCERPVTMLARPFASIYLECKPVFVKGWSSLPRLSYVCGQVVDVFSDNEVKPEEALSPPEVSSHRDEETVVASIHQDCAQSSERSVESPGKNNADTKSPSVASRDEGYSTMSSDVQYDGGNNSATCFSTFPNTVQSRVTPNSFREEEALRTVKTTPVPYAGGVFVEDVLEILKEPKVVEKDVSMTREDDNSHVALRSDRGLRRSRSDSFVCCPVRCETLVVYDSARDVAAVANVRPFPLMLSPDDSSSGTALEWHRQFDPASLDSLHSSCCGCGEAVVMHHDLPRDVTMHQDSTSANFNEDDWFAVDWLQSNDSITQAFPSDCYTDEEVCNWSFDYSMQDVDLSPRPSQDCFSSDYDNATVCTQLSVSLPSIRVVDDVVRSFLSLPSKSRLSHTNFCDNHQWHKGLRQPEGASRSWPIASGSQLSPVVSSRDGSTKCVCSHSQLSLSKFDLGDHPCSVPRPYLADGLLKILPPVSDDGLFYPIETSFKTDFYTLCKVESNQSVNASYKNLSSPFCFGILQVVASGSQTKNSEDTFKKPSVTHKLYSDNGTASVLESSKESDFVKCAHRCGASKCVCLVDKEHDEQGVVPQVDYMPKDNECYKRSMESQNATFLKEGHNTTWIHFEADVDLSDPKARANLLDSMVASSTSDSSGMSNDEEDNGSSHRRYQYLHDMHRIRRFKKAASDRKPQCLQYISAARPSILGRDDFFYRYGEKEQEAVASFDFLESMASSASDISAVDTHRRNRRSSEAALMDTVERLSLSDSCAESFSTSSLHLEM